MVILKCFCIFGHLLPIMTADGHNRPVSQEKLLSDLSVDRPLLSSQTNQRVSLNVRQQELFPLT